MKAVLVTFLLAAFLLTFSSMSYSQFAIGQKTGSLSVGIGGGGLTGTGAVPVSAEFNFLSFEKNINAGIYASYASTSEDVYYGTWKYTYIIIAAQGNWHFMPGDKVDPFAGVSLGYNIGTFSGPSGYPNPSIGGFFVSVQGGLNYWFSPEWAIQGRVGYFPFVSIGVTHNFN